jgi:hypothetical protein
MHGLAQLPAGGGHLLGAIEAAKILRSPEALLYHPSTVFCACKPVRELGLAFDFRRRLRAGYKFFPRVLIEDPLNDAGAETQRFADPVNTVPFSPQFQDARFNRGSDAASTQLCALCLCASQASVHSLANDAPLEFGKYAEHLEHRLAGGRRSVEALLMEKQIDAFVMEALEDRQQIG